MPSVSESAEAVNKTCAIKWIRIDSCTIMVDLLKTINFKILEISCNSGGFKDEILDPPLHKVDIS